MVREGWGFNSSSTGWSRKISRARWQIHMISEFLTTRVFEAFVFRTFSNRCTTSSRFISPARPVPAAEPCVGLVGPPEADASGPGDAAAEAGGAPAKPIVGESGLNACAPGNARNAEVRADPEAPAVGSDIEFLAETACAEADAADCPLCSPRTYAVEAEEVESRGSMDKVRGTLPPSLAPSLWRRFDCDDPIWVPTTERSAERQAECRIRTL